MQNLAESQACGIGHRKQRGPPEWLARLPCRPEQRLELPGVDVTNARLSGPIRLDVLHGIDFEVAEGLDRHAQCRLEDPLSAVDRRGPLPMSLARGEPGKIVN